MGLVYVQGLILASGFLSLDLSTASQLWISYVCEKQTPSGEFVTAAYSIIVAHRDTE
jgi:hypothetical protein